MNDPNPYAPPTAEVADVIADTSIDFERLDRVASAQRLLMWALLGTLFAGAIRSSIDPLVGTIAQLIAVIASMVGAVRLDGALKGSVLSRVLYAITMILPLVNLIIMFTLSRRATKVLRAAGYQIGFLGAKPRY